MDRDIRYIAHPSIILPKQLRTVTLDGPLLENRRLAFDSNYVGVGRVWEPTNEGPRHGIKLAGIEVCDCEEHPPFNLKSMPLLNYFTLRLLVNNSSNHVPFAIHRVFARLYDEDAKGEVDLSRNQTCIWGAIGSPKWMAPKTAMLYGEPTFFDARTKSIQLIALLASKKIIKTRDGKKKYELQTQPEILPFDYILQRNSSFDENPRWSLVKAQGPK